MNDQVLKRVGRSKVQNPRLYSSFQIQIDPTLFILDLATMKPNPRFLIALHSSYISFNLFL